MPRNQVAALGALTLSVIALAAAGMFIEARREFTFATPERNLERILWVKNERRVASSNRADAALVFIGDSLTEHWYHDGQDIWRREFSPKHALNLGVAGDRVRDVTARIRWGALVGLNPQTVILLAGTNDIATPAEPLSRELEGLVLDVQARLPKARIILIGILPRDIPGSSLRDKNFEVNQRLSRLHWPPSIQFVDPSSKFLKTDGTLRGFKNDLLHLDAEGYAILADAIRPLIQ